MKRSARHYLLSCTCLLLVFSMTYSKGNIFGWTHQAGSNNNVQAMTSDGYTALRDKDYTKALEYFSKALESDPNNSQAIYGYSSAVLANAGLDVAGLIANLVSSNGSPAPSYDGLAHSIASASKGALSPSQSNILPEAILNNIDKIRAAVNKVFDVAHLQNIANGIADGTIDPKNADVNLNLAFCLILRAAVSLNDIVEIDSSYTVSLKNVTGHEIILEQAGEDIVSAYHRLLLVAESLNLADSSAISKIKEDTELLFNDYKSKLADDGINIQADINVDYLK